MRPADASDARPAADRRHDGGASGRRTAHTAGAGGTDVAGPGVATTPWAAGRLDGRRGPSRLLFGCTFEDPAIELARFPPEGTVLCIAGAGDTARALAAPGRRVIAVDVNPHQLAEVGRRLAGLPPRSGAVDRLLAVGRAGLVPLGWRRARLARFCRLDDPDEQVREWRRLTGPPVRTALAVGLSPWALRLAYGPRFTRLVPPRFGDCLVDRIGRRIARAPNRANPWLRQLLTGTRPPSPPLPAASSLSSACFEPADHREARANELAPSVGAGLRPGGIAEERPSPSPPRAVGLGPGQVGDEPAQLVPGAIELWLGDVAEVLAGLPGRSLDGISLSNVLDGPGAAYRDRLLAQARRVARPGAPIVVRTLLEPSDAAARAWADRDRALIWGGVAVHRA